MKYIIIVLLSMLSSGLFAGKVEVDVVGMSCSMCVESITKELKATEKAENISVVVDEKKARFQEIKDKKITDAEIRQAIKRAGYEAVKIRRH